MFRLGFPLAIAPPGVYLGRDNWNDWFTFQTMFTMIVVMPDGTRHYPGSVKIGQAGLQRGGELLPGFRGPDLPQEFRELTPGTFFSLGQDENYYETISNLDPAWRDWIFRGLQDCAFDLTIFQRHRHELVMTESLLRSVAAQNVESRLHRLAHGNAVLTRYEFSFGLPQQVGGQAPPVLQFSVTPDSVPPTNIHVIVGRNGVGKTTCLESLANTILMRRMPQDQPLGLFRPILALGEQPWTFAGLVSVSFSAFDKYVPPSQAELQMRAAFVGLRKEVLVDGAVRYAVKDPADLLADFIDSMGVCRTGPRLLGLQLPLRAKLAKSGRAAQQTVTMQQNG